MFTLKIGLRAFCYTLIKKIIPLAWELSIKCSENLLKLA